MIKDNIKFKYNETNDMLYWYDSNRGIYRPNGENLIENILSRVKMPDYYYMVYTDHIEDNDIEEIRNQIKDITANVLNEIRVDYDARYH